MYSFEAMWRILGYAMQYRTPNVILLFLHLEGDQVVVHYQADNDVQRRAKAPKSVSDLMSTLHDHRDLFLMISHFFITSTV